MSKVLLHNLSASYVGAAPELYSFDRNAMMFAESGDAVVVRGDLPDAAHLAYLQSIDVVANGVQFFVSEKSASAFSVFDDKKLITALREYFAVHPDDWELDTYMYTHHEHAFAERLGISTTRRPDHFYRYGTKSGFRTFAKGCSIAIPRGYEHVADATDAGLAAARLFLKGVAKVVVKQDEGVAGLSLHQLNRRTFLERISQFDIEGLLPRTGILPSQSQEYVVEEWCGDVVSAPSIEFCIQDDGVTTFSSMHEQLFYPDRQTYRGCRSAHWLSESIQKETREKGQVLASALAGEGVRGPVAFDAVVRANGEVLFVEANIRRIMSSYAHQIAQRVSVGMPYTSVRVERRGWKGKKLDELLEELGSILYTSQSTNGVIPYDIGMLSSHGKLSLLCIGASVEAVESLYRQVAGR